MPESSPARARSRAARMVAPITRVPVRVTDPDSGIDGWMVVAFIDWREARRRWRLRRAMEEAES